MSHSAPTAPRFFSHSIMPGDFTHQRGLMLSAVGETQIVTMSIQ